MFLGGLKADRNDVGLSWNEVEQLSGECEDLLEDVNAFIAKNFPNMKPNTDTPAQPNQGRSQRSGPPPSTRPKNAESSNSGSDTSVSGHSSAPGVIDHATESSRELPGGVLGAVCHGMATAKSAWQSYEDAYEVSRDESYKGRGFDRYFSHGVEDRSASRLRKFNERNFDNRYYDFHYLEHHLRENDDERLADRMRADERMSEARADERASIERDAGLDADRRDDYDDDRLNDRYRDNNDR